MHSGNFGEFFSHVTLTQA